MLLSSGDKATVVASIISFASALKSGLSVFEHLLVGVFEVRGALVEAKFKGMFVTAVFGKLNVKTGELIFINAGHESILTFDKGKN